MDIEERIDRIELRLVELELKMDHLLEMHEKLLAMGLKLDLQQLEEAKIKVAQLALDLGSRQN